MINLIKITLSTSAISFSGTSESYTGSVDTDLAAGTYRLQVDKAKRIWIVQGSDPGLRFYVTLEGADPWK